MNRLGMAGFVISALFLVCGSAFSEVRTRTITYKQGDVELEGLLAFDDDKEKGGQRPGVVVVHDWMGRSAHYDEIAVRLAKMGYIAFSADIYGKDVRPKDSTEARVFSSKFKKDCPLMRARIQAALKTLKEQEWTDAKRTAAMGYCFGGTVVLELARDGADVAGIVSFHGGLSTPTPENAKNIKAKVLILHGADDPHVPEKEMVAFQDEMRKGGVDWQMVLYANAVHAFTNKSAGDDNSKGAAYNEKADRRSWKALQVFLAELFGEGER